MCLCAGEGPAQDPPKLWQHRVPSRNHHAADNKRHLRTRNAAAVEAWSRVAVIFQQNDFFSRSDTYTPPPDSLETEAAWLGSRRILRARLSSLFTLGSQQGLLQSTALSPACPRNILTSAPEHSASSWIFKFRIVPVLKAHHAAQRGLLAAHPFLLLPQQALPFFSMLYR